MINIATLKADLIAWLESLPSSQTVGIRNDPNRCALSNFLTKPGHRAVTVRKGKAGIVHLPRWAGSFYQQADRCCGRTTGEYTAANALAILARV